MEQYISKSDIVAEIEKTEKYAKHRVNEAVDKYWQIHFDGWVTACRSIMSFLDALEVKEVEVPVSKDLEEAADKYLVEKGYLLTTNNGEHLAEVEAKGLFKAGAQWQKQQTIDKACEWLKENKDHPLIGCEDVCLSGYLTDEFIEYFKKAMLE